ncbi:MAG TPA: hypothetical protein VLJ68_01710, partial [Chitinophagaceae bacterium]|nr:hypothetical protein [Chitinophagaceae bacterium]
RIPRSANLKTGKDKFLDNYFLSTNPGVKLTDFVVENEDVDTLPLLQSFSFTRPTGGSGDYRYFTLNMFSGLEKNQFIAQTRISDVFFGANQFYYISGSFTLPDNYSFDVLPENIKMITPDTSIIATRRMNVAGNELGALVTVEFKKPVFTPEEYPDMMEFYKKLFDMLNEQIVIKKK